jgi:hypothetical protein
MVRLLRTGGITVALCGIFFLLGILFADVALGFQLRDSIASLLGAALGAAITVAGSFWLVGAAESYNSDRFKRLVRDNIRFMREQAQTTKGSLEEADANDFEGIAPEELAAEIKAGHEKLLDSAALFEQLAPFAEITDYSARIALQKLQQTLFTEKRYIKKRSIGFRGTTRSPCCGKARKILGQSPTG